jgi:peptide/nickel transport system ATP-binding protein
VQALDGVSFVAGDGEVVGLAGESGCGKSTLGKSLTRLDGRMRHVGGTVELDGKELPIADSSDGVREELLRRLELVGLDPEVLDRYRIELSGGMKQRMVMVISTLLNPSLLVADEITSALDVSTQKAVAEKAPTDALVSSPRHPYTRMLISALPEVGVRFGARRLQGIPGSPPSLLDPPTGCRFRDRCPLAFAKCAVQPPFLEVAPDHFAACWKAF